MSAEGVPLIPAAPAAPGSWHDQLRRALAGCTYPAGTRKKRFSADLAVMPLERVTASQWAYALRLAWTMRRQMPEWLVPPRELLAGIPAPTRGRPARPVPGEAERPRLARVPPASQPALPLW